MDDPNTGWYTYGFWHFRAYCAIFSIFMALLLLVIVVGRRTTKLAAESATAAEQQKRQRKMTVTILLRLLLPPIKWLRLQCPGHLLSVRHPVAD